MKKDIFLIVAAAGVMLAFAGSAMADQHRGHGMKKGAHGAMMLDRLDTNKDGSIDRAEMDAAHMEHFSNMDADGDGVVSQAEMRAFHERKREEARAKREARMFKSLDSNGDGVLSEDEINARRQAMFEKLDKDGDGVITAEERKTAHMDRRKHMKERMKHKHKRHMQHDGADDGMNETDDGGN